MAQHMVRLRTSMYWILDFPLIRVNGMLAQYTMLLYLLYIINGILVYWLLKIAISSGFIHQKMVIFPSVFWINGDRSDR